MIKIHYSLITLPFKLTANGKPGTIGALAQILVEMENKGVLEAFLLHQHIGVERAMALASKHEIVISKNVKVIIYLIMAFERDVFYITTTAEFI